MLSAWKLCQSSSISGPSTTRKPRSEEHLDDLALHDRQGMQGPRTRTPARQREVDAVGFQQGGLGHELQGFPPLVDGPLDRLACLVGGLARRRGGPPRTTLRATSAPLRSADLRPMTSTCAASRSSRVAAPAARAIPRSRSASKIPSSSAASIRRPSLATRYSPTCVTAGQAICRPTAPKEPPARAVHSRRAIRPASLRSGLQRARIRFFGVGHNARRR